MQHKHVPKKNSSMRWSVEEKEQLVEMFKDHVPVHKIATHFGRSERAVLAQFYTLGYSTSGYWKGVNRESVSEPSVKTSVKTPVVKAKRIVEKKGFWSKLKEMMS